MITRRTLLAAAAAALPARAASGRIVYVVPNFHPASCGWLTTFSKERVYCANSYFDHLDRVRDDPNYAFALSEVNNIIAMMNFRPERTEELRRRIRERRVELVNAFFLESTINLSGGEALVRLGVEGIRWQQAVFGVKPRIAWNIDICGQHEQMPQIVAGLGLDAMVYCRKNSTGSAVHWSESPDGTRVIALSPGHYSELREVMAATQPLDAKGLAQVDQYLAKKVKITPEGAPILVLAGSADYALAPLVKEYPSAFLKQWREFRPQDEIRFTTPGAFLDAVLPAARSGRMKLPTLRGGTEYDYYAFWIQSPRVKTSYRRCEHALQAAESLAAAASLRTKSPYPAETLYHAWLQMCLNMDRNTLWGAAGGMVFEDEKSWDARDRFAWVERASSEVMKKSAATLMPKGAGVALFNPLNWKRTDPFTTPLVPEVMAAQRLPDGTIVARGELPSVSLGAWNTATAAASREVPLPEKIETAHYTARIDPQTGALASLMVKGREMLGGLANVLYAERPKQQRGDPGDHTTVRGARVRLATSSDSPQRITAFDGPLASVVRSEGTFFGGGAAVRTVVFYKDHPRIDFSTELNDIPDRTLVMAEFPLASGPTAIRRGVPYGFASELKAISPAVRWSHYTIEGGGVALLDRGLSGREITGRLPLLFLLNATDKYYKFPNPWLSGQGKHVLEYALVAHTGSWREARIPHLAWEYNAPPVALEGAAPSRPVSWLETSPNVIVECLRRDGRDIEVRLAECFGEKGTAEVKLTLPHRGAALTDMLGGHAKPLRGGPAYRFDVRPQQIVTLRFHTASEVKAPPPLMQWGALVPEAKRPALHEYSDVKGHPPRG